LWVKKHEPQNFKRISKIMLPKDYVAYKMSNVFATDVSDASGTLYMDVQNKQ
jgi:xylulokinase